MITSALKSVYKYTNTTRVYKDYLPLLTATTGAKPAIYYLGLLTVLEEEKS